MEQVVYKIGEVSARLGLHDKNSNTLRGWAEEFGEFLSASANPAPGQPRRFTARDLQVLMAVRDYRAHHLTFDEIRERLRAGEHNVTAPEAEEAAAPSHDPSFAAGSQSLLPLAQMERVLAPLVASVDEWRRLAEEYRGRLEAREARIEALEQRIEELYARLDAAPRGAPQMAATEVQEPAAAAPVPPNGAAAGGETPHQADADGPAEQATDTAAAPLLFPLPIVERRPQAEANGAMAASAAPRRRWWQVWR